METAMSLEKKYVRNNGVCKVTFRLPEKAANSAKSVALVGDFNGWSLSATPLRKSRTGGFELTLDLKTGKEYQFRYLIDSKNWENDWQADKYVPAGVGNAENSVVVV
jgi:1,4-alpha-glucan branching enzyme